MSRQKTKAKCLQKRQPFKANSLNQTMGEENFGNYNITKQHNRKLWSMNC
jgi:hypothetical protein